MYCMQLQLLTDHRKHLLQPSLLWLPLPYSNLYVDRIWNAVLITLAFRSIVYAYPEVCWVWVSALRSTLRAKAQQTHLLATS